MKATYRDVCSHKTGQSVLYYNGIPLTITKDYVRIGLMTLSNVALNNAPVAINQQI
jgi:hypothetical protein